MLMHFWNKPQHFEVLCYSLSVKPRTCRLYYLMFQHFARLIFISSLSLLRILTTWMFPECQIFIHFELYITSNVFNIYIKKHENCYPITMSFIEISIGTDLCLSARDSIDNTTVLFALGTVYQPYSTCWKTLWCLGDRRWTDGSPVTL